MSYTLLITGASTGLGAAIARRMATRGNCLILVARNIARLQETAEACRQAGANDVHIHAIDLSDSDAVAAWLPTLPAIDVLINNAGYGIFKPALDCSNAETAALFQLNTLAMIQLTQGIAPAMVAKGRGHIIFIASQAGKIATPKSAIYAASKHAILGYANALRLELKPSGVIVTTVNPGPMETPFFDSADPDGSYRKKLGQYWLLNPENIAALTCAAIGKNVREINRPRLMNLATNLYPLLPRLGDWLTVKFFDRK
ncbi:MAG: SDR family oxidoreductase [Cardiobacteriaceae bacterium]|nr:SDR family oxidoreductase [Cardiobacteriaceae bacterium]